MPPLRLGVVGDDVVSLQLALIAIGLVAGPASGAFDQVTQRAVIELQRRSNLPQTGVMDDATWNALYQMQASVAPSDDGGVTYGPRAPGTIEGDTTQITGAGPSQGQLLFWGLLAGGAYYWAHNQGKRGESGSVHEYDEDDGDDEGDGEDEEDDFEDDEDDGPQESLRDLDDAVTDSLIDEPAVISASGRAGDCKKAAMRLMRVQALVQRPSERSLYENVVKKVASNCRGNEGAIEEVIEDEATRQEDMIEDLLDVIGQTPVRERAKDTDREANIEARRKAQALYKARKHDDRDDGPAIDTSPHRGQSRRKLYESGFRKVKTKLTRKTTSERESTRSTGKGQGHRRGASAIEVRRGGKPLFKMRKEKAKTKRGYTWRKDS